MSLLPSASTFLPLTSGALPVLTAGLALALAPLALRRPLRALQRSPRGRAAWVHLSNRLYLNLVLEQLLPSRPAAGQGADRSGPAPQGAAAQASIDTGAVGRVARDAAALVHGAAPAPEAGASAAPVDGEALARETFHEVAARGSNESWGAPTGLLQPINACADAHAAGILTDGDLAAALRFPRLRGHVALADLHEHLARADRHERSDVPTCAAVAGDLAERSWPDLVVRRIAAWAQRYRARGTTLWSSPFRDLPPYEAWLAEMAIDCSDTVLGLEEAQAQLRALPREPEALVALAGRRLRVPPQLLEAYLRALLDEVLDGLSCSTAGPEAAEAMPLTEEFLRHLLAIRLAWELILLEEFAMAGAELAWRRALQQARRRAAGSAGAGAARDCHLALHEAYEHAEERRIAAALRGEEARQVCAGVFIADPGADRPCAGGEALHHAYDAGKDANFETLERLLSGALVDAARERLHGPVPGRLAAFVAAPITAINAAIDRHATLRHLVDNGWLRLFALYDGASVIVRYEGNLHWGPTTVQDVA